MWMSWSWTEHTTIQFPVYIRIEKFTSDPCRPRGSQMCQEYKALGIFQYLVAPSLPTWDRQPLGLRGWYFDSLTVEQKFAWLPLALNPQHSSRILGGSRMLLSTLAIGLLSVDDFDSPAICIILHTILSLMFCVFLRFFCSVFIGTSAISSSDSSEPHCCGSLLPKQLRFQADIPSINPVSKQTYLRIDCI